MRQAIRGRPCVSGDKGSPASEGICAPLLRNKPILSGTFPGDSGDVDVYGHWRRDAALGAAGGLEALEFVQGLIKAALYGGLVAGEL